MQIESLEEFQRIIADACVAYNKYLLDDQLACIEEVELKYAQQRLVQVREFYPVMAEICSKVGKLTPFKE